MIVALPGLFSYLFYYIKVGFKGSKLYRHVFVMSPDQERYEKKASSHADNNDLCNLLH